MERSSPHPKEYISTTHSEVHKSSVIILPLVERKTMERIIKHSWRVPQIGGDEKFNSISEIVVIKNKYYSYFMDYMIRR